MDSKYYIYILTNYNKTTLYTGVTNNLVRRVYEHREGVTKGFSNKYKIYKLVYYEIYEDIENAIIREKQIKHYKRDKKDKLINDFNLSWKDLYNEICK